MGQRLLQVRVRPARVVVLVNRDAESQELLLAFEFFSKLWGGRFGQILAVDPQSCDELTRYRLERSRPDYVYGIDIDDGHWASAVLQACQPRGYGPLRPDFVRGIKQPHREDYCLVDQALIHLFRTRDLSKGQRQTLRLVSPETTFPLAIFCAATFGIHHPNLRSEYYDMDTPLHETTLTSFLGLATDFVTQCQQSWLDVTGHQLIPRIEGWGRLPPTIVLIQRKAADLSLFWNLRTASDTSGPAWIIPLPSEAASEPASVGKIKDWLLSFLAHGPLPNYCQVTSQTVPEKLCRQFASDLQSALAGSPIEAVVYEAPRNRLPVVIPFEYEDTWAVNITGRKLTIQPPRPRAFESVSSARSWFVDLLKDIKTGRAVEELQLPSGPAVFELLNGPCPPSFEHTAIPRTGDGVDSINIRCSDPKEVIRLCLPTSEEILEEILREHGVEPLIDEKRTLYLPAIRKFGGLNSTAKAFTGTSGLILASLQGEAQTVRELKSLCRLGNGTIPGQGYLDSIEHMFRTESERIKRVGRRRFAQYARNQSPENQRLTSVLDYWADRAVLTREWKIGPCSRCNRSSFVARLDLQRRVNCPHCGYRVNLPESVPLGYALHRTVRLAMREGIVPVVLTGRFLRRMSHRGFVWLPGVKFKLGEDVGDIDLIACCDGHLVFCECKQLMSTPSDARVWEDAISQFLETAAVAKMCEASLAVFAAQVDDYPADIRAQIANKMPSGLAYLLLTKQDLEKGSRDVRDDSHSRPLGLHDLIPEPFAERPREPNDKPRTINLGWGVYTQ